MRLFETESIYNKENQTWEEVYYIDGEEVDAETYFDEQELEALESEEDEDEGCGGDCVECLLDEYIERLQAAMPCPHCMRQVLVDFMLEVIDEE